jgi:hypothetical protein
MPGRGKETDAARFQNPDDFFQCKIYLRYMLMGGIGEHCVEVSVREREDRVGHHHIRLVVAVGKMYGNIDAGVITYQILEESLGTANLQTFLFRKLPTLQKGNQEREERMVPAVIVDGIDRYPVDGFVE